MSALDPAAFVAEVSKRLLAGRESLPWPERRDAAAKLGRLLATSAPSESAIALANLLAEDAKPEVRKEIAEALVHLPEDGFVKLASKLSEDSNDYVKTAADRAIARRRRSVQQSKKLKRGIDRSQSGLAKFGDVYGPKATKQAAEIAHDLYSGLVGQAYHDINNIVSPIKSNISTLRRQHETGSVNSKACLEILTDMSRCADYLEQFFKDMRDYAKATGEGAERRRERLSDLVIEARNMAFAALRLAGTLVDSVKLTVDVPETMTVCVARHQVVMAVIHVLRNAYESFATVNVNKPESCVRIVAMPAGDGMISLQISDTGPGIHPEDLEIFREFQPRRNAKKRNSTGFGLPTALQYTQLQGGQLRLDGAPGKGTTVTLLLPTECQDDEA